MLRAYKTFGSLAIVAGLMASMAGVADAQKGKGGGGGGGGNRGGGGGDRGGSRSAPAARSAPAQRSAPTVRSAPSVQKSFSSKGNDNRSAVNRDRNDDKPRLNDDGPNVTVNKAQGSNQAASTRDRDDRNRAVSSAAVNLNRNQGGVRGSGYFDPRYGWNQGGWGPYGWNGGGHRHDGRHHDDWWRFIAYSAVANWFGGGFGHHYYGGWPYYGFYQPWYTYGRYGYFNNNVAYATEVIPAASDVAQVEVRVAPDAQVHIGTHQTRRYVTPPLEEGYNYVYNVRASWTEGGEVRSVERDIRVRAGEHAVVDFTRTPSTVTFSNLRE
jgi:uncharacterized protein (TIGR03000 family)